MAAICYAHIVDLSPGDAESRLCSSRWFQRGWTLQELLASGKINFYDSTWKFIGTKISLAGWIESATGIPRPFLSGMASLQEASIAQRMSWASKRSTTRPEDTAYCLLGIFDVMIPLLYGEKEESSFARLQEAIMKRIRDDSILAWALHPDGPPDEAARTAIPGGALASSPSAFGQCGDVARRSGGETMIKAFDIFGGSMPISLSLYEPSKGKTYGLLNCGPELSPAKVVAIPLQRVSSSSAQKEYIRPHGKPSILVPSPSSHDTQLIQIKTERLKSTGTTLDRRHWIYLQEPYPRGLQLIDVWPQNTWIKDNAMIRTANDAKSDVSKRYLAKFRVTGEECPDFVVGMRFRMRSGKADLSYNLMTCSRDAPLADVRDVYQFISRKQLAQVGAKSGSVELAVNIGLQSVATQDMFVVRWTVGHAKPTSTVDATLEREMMSARVDMLDLIHREDDVAVLSRETENKLKKASQDLEGVRTELAGVTSEIERLLEEKSALEGKIAQQMLGLDALQESAHDVAAKGKQLAHDRALAEHNLREMEHRAAGSPTTPNGKQGSNDGQKLDIAVGSLISKLGSNGEPAVDGDVPPPLIWAASQGHARIVELLLNDGASPTSKDQNGDTALIAAVLGGHETVVKVLLSHQATKPIPPEPSPKPTRSSEPNPPRRKSSDDIRPHESTSAKTDDKRSSRRGFRAMLHGMKAKFEDLELEEQPVSRAPSHSRLPKTVPAPPTPDPSKEGVNLLETADSQGCTPLQHAAIIGNLTICQLLLDAEANVNAFRRKPLKKAPLCLATMEGHTEVMTLLISRGADVDGSWSMGKPLMSAVKRGRMDVINLLLRAGAEIDLEEKFMDGSNNHRVTLVGYATLTGHPSVAALLQELGSLSRRERVRRLMDETPASSPSDIEESQGEQASQQSHGSRPQTQSRQSTRPQSITSTKPIESLDSPSNSSQTTPAIQGTFSQSSGSLRETVSSVPSRTTQEADVTEEKRMGSPRGPLDQPSAANINTMAVT